MTLDLGYLHWGVEFGRGFQGTLTAYAKVELDMSGLEDGWVCQVRAQGFQGSQGSGMGKAEWDRLEKADVLSLCPVVPPVMKGGSPANWRRQDQQQVQDTYQAEA